MSPDRIVIVGAGAAGHRCALELRQFGFAGAVVLVGAESHAPYDRTLLSKEYLCGAIDEAALTLTGQDEFESQEIELRLGASAVGLRPDRHELSLADGTQLAYDRLVIATGGTPVQSIGLCPAGSHLLRTVDDARALREMVDCRHLVVIGGGFVGAEVAASARELGLDVTIVEALPTLLSRVVGHDVGDRIADLHRAHGVRVRCHTAVRAVRRSGDGRFEVVLGDTVVLFADAVVVGIGMAPAIGWLRGSGVRCDRGILTDPLCRTSAPDVYAVGDCARWRHPAYDEPIRIEHWDTATRHGAAAARSVLGVGEPFSPIPYFWSIQYGVRYQWIGSPFRAQAIQIEPGGSVSSFVARYTTGDRLDAVFAADRPYGIAAARSHLQATHEVYA